MNGDAVETRYVTASGFWKITASGVAQILLLLFAIVGFFITYDRGINETRNISNQNTRDIAALAKTVSEINERGTNYSRSGIPLETTAIANLSERTNQHDRVLADLLPKIERMQTTMEFLRDYIQEQKAATKKQN